MRSKTFFITLGVAFLLLFLLDHGVQWFQYFTIWTKNQNIKVSENYLPEWLVDDAALGTVIAQLYQSPTMITSDGLFNKAIKLFRDSKQLMEIDIVSMLKKASNPRKTLDIHLAHITKKLDEIEQLADLLQTMSDKSLQESTTCLDRKKDGDRLFLEWLVWDNPRLLQQWLENSVWDAPCYITNRIYANAYAYMRERILTYKSALLQRSRILEQNKESLVRYADRLDEPIDQELRRLQVTLSQLNAFELQVSQQIGTATTQSAGTVNPWTVEDFASFFMYGFPWSKAPLPRLNIRFNDNNVNVPNFEQWWFKQPSTNPIKDWSF